MKGVRFKEEQIIGVLNQLDRGMPIKDLCRQHGISQQTVYWWKSKFGGMQISDAKKLRALESENTRLKRMVADMALDIERFGSTIQKSLLSSKIWPSVADASATGAYSRF